MTPALERYLNHIYDELKDDHPEVSAFALKSIILDKIRQRANEQADMLICAHVLTEQVKALKVLAQM